MFDKICTNCGKVFTVERLRQAPMTCSLECRIARRDGALKRRRDFRQIVPCSVCGAIMMIPPSRLATKKTCSRKCHGASVTRDKKGIIRTSRLVTCDYCGEQTRKYASRVKEGSRIFCNADCYHAWDSDYKSTPEMVAALAERALTTLARNTSKIEDTVAMWLDNHDITYERQVRLRYWRIDFQCGDVYVEVNGCYWHGCPTCHPSPNANQRDRHGRDKGKQTYCKDRNIPLIFIWEHDIRRHDFTALAPLLHQSTGPHL